MHRTNYVPRIVLGGLLLGLLLGRASPVCAQARLPVNERRTLNIGGTETLPMYGKDKRLTVIKTVINERDTVVRVQGIPTDPTRVIVTGLTLGTSRVTLIDENDAQYVYEITVQFDLPYVRSILQRAVPTASVEPIAVSNNSVILTGTVARTEDIDVILRTAAAVLQSLTLGTAPQGAQPAGGGTTNINIGGPGGSGGAFSGGGPGGGTVSTGPPTGIQVINALRVGGVMQVQLDCVVAFVSRTELRRMNFEFLNEGNGHILASTQGAALTIPSAGIAGTFPGFPTITNATGMPNGGPSNIFFALFNTNQDFFGFLQALRDERLAKILAEPKLVTLSGRPASMLSGGEQAIPEAQGLGTISVRFERFGTQLSFLPIVLGNGKIYLEVEPEISNIDPTVGTTIQGTSVPGRQTQRVRTAVEMEDGQTFALAGLILHQVLGTTTKLPILGDMPFLGAFFSSKSYSDQESELVVLVTPHLVDPMDCSQVPKVLPGQETRTPDDFELFLEGILEAPRGPRDVCPDKRYVPAFKHSPTAGQYPCAGNGHGGGPLGCEACLNGAPVVAAPAPAAPSGAAVVAAPAPAAPSGAAVVAAPSAAAPNKPVLPAEASPPAGDAAPAAPVAANSPAAEENKPAAVPQPLLQATGAEESK